ncbi:hypothetical protein CVT26_011837 [Gymnopilus dilepis]|uniref:Uncharacterized protein n=1 Tax=Gymnopilus dilepis TaxID=231916 RepID=A0A409YFW9_9AGAR|nr:hypothetical protein CVT26_011837 [Gymnopilus dilepis]
MVKLATSVVAATLLSVPVLAVASEKRSVAESDLYGRDFAEEENDLLTREDLEDLFGRDFVEELEAREPFGLGFVSKGLGLIRHGISHVRHGGSGGHHHHHFGGVGGGDNSQQQQQSRREFIDDLEEREPLGFGMFSSVNHGIHALKHGFSHLRHGGGHHFHHMSSMGGGSSGGDPSQQQPQRRELTDEDDLFTREFVDDLEEREPLGFGMFSHGLHALKHGFSHLRHGGGHHFHHMSSMGGGSSGGDPSQQQPQRRELTDEDDLFTREFVDDLEEREPLGFGMFSHGLHALKHGFSHLRHGGGHHFHHHMSSMGGGSSGGDPSQQQQQSRRDLGDYGYYDELD